MMDEIVISLKPFECGQVWKLADSSIQIGLVGKLLVHYKHYRDQKPRAPTCLTSKRKLEKFLREHGATLVQD
jgi:hypothetical protein